MSDRLRFQMKEIKELFYNSSNTTNESMIDLPFNPKDVKYHFSCFCGAHVVVSFVYFVIFSYLASVCLHESSNGPSYGTISANKLITVAAMGHVMNNLLADSVSCLHVPCHLWQYP